VKCAFSWRVSWFGFSYSASESPGSQNRFRPQLGVIGFLVFVGCLGYISAYRIFANEERLLAIGKELEIARRIQSSILPQSVPILAGFELAARYVPMSAVAGDFYDFLVMDEKRIGVLDRRVRRP